MTPISVFIITKNEADRIGNVIKMAAKIADEIIVIDSGSVDETVKISSALGAKVIFNAWNGYGAQKIFGELQCRNKWILNLDADEELSPELCDEITRVFADKIADAVAGFKIKIVNKFPFEQRPKKLAYYYNQIRLYNIDFAGFKNSTVHDSVVLKSPHQQQILQLNNIVYHQSFRSYSHWLDKINSYSSMQAKDAFEKNKCPSIVKVFLTPTLAFLKAYFVRRYFIYGVNGIIYSYIFAFSRFVKMIKIREIYRK